MKPRDTYENIATRARHLLDLHDGLVNTRQRRIRSDWGEAFCRVMHWKKSSNIERVDSKDAIIVLRDGAKLAPDDFTRDSLADLLRAALALGVGALDRYVHERVVKRIIGALSGKKLTQQQQDLAIPVVPALEAARRAVRASVKRTSKAYEAHEGTPGSAAKVQCRPANEMRMELQKYLHTRAFQSWREIQHAFSLLGITDLKAQIIDREGIADFRKEIVEPLNRAVRRRNVFVHEGDLVRHKRAGKVRPEPISRTFVKDSLDFLNRLVDVLERVS